MTKKNIKKAKEDSIETVERIWDLATQSIKPLSHNIINSWAEELFKAAQDEEIITLEDWLGKKGLVRATFYRLCETNQALKEAHAFALQMIGNRRWKGCAKFDLSAAAVMPSMAHYDERYIRDEERRARLKAQAAQALQATEQVVHVHEIPSDPSIPHAPTT